MQIKHVANIVKGQDGAVWGNFLFRFDTRGMCFVYDKGSLSLETEEPVDLELFAQFTLGGTDVLRPHCNSVVFGPEYYSEDDEFPLLYANIYNNYAKTENTLKGVCLVYRLQRKENLFSAELLQMIEIGFTEDALWKSSEEDARPYGNFVIDREKGIMYAYTMRDASRTTRYFAFALPKVTAGEKDATFGIRKVRISKADILDWFDCPYHYFVQGGCFHDGKVYSLEGFTDSKENPPALRIIDAVQKQQLHHVQFGDFGLSVEPEMIDFCEDTCFYADLHGSLYIISY